MDDLRPVYAISVAAELAHMHPQTLRQYDRLGLVCPQRVNGRNQYSTHYHRYKYHPHKNHQ